MTLAGIAICAPSFSYAGTIQLAAAAAFAKPHQRVDIGGRKINLFCTGTGTTTVLFDAPAGEAGWAWFKVQPDVAKYTRACIFDRAGFGFSDPAPRPNTSENAAEDLHKALSKAGIRSPYLLVGNSLGGGNVQVFAYTYPLEVKGLVLVEPQTEDETIRSNAVTAGLIDKIYAMVKAHDQQCLEAAHNGFKAGSEEVGEPEQYFGSALGKEVRSTMSTRTYWRTRVDEANASEASDNQLRALRKPFGDLPVLVLTRGVNPYADPSKPQSAVNKALEVENEKIHKELAALSSRGQQRTVSGASHNIQADDPDAVTQAIVDVLRQVQ
jgi:pimeloyl-ACP methyl ester carboxylesterase